MGQKSPAKVLRSAKRITKFLRNKWKTDIPDQLQPTHAQNISVSRKPCPELPGQLVQIKNVPTSSPPITYSQAQTLPKPLDLENFKLILKQNATERQNERDKLRIERKIEREKDLEQFQLMLDLALPP